MDGVQLREPLEGDVQDGHVRAHACGDHGGRLAGHTSADHGHPGAAGAGHAAHQHARAALRLEEVVGARGGARRPATWLMGASSGRERPRVTVS